MAARRPGLASLAALAVIAAMALTVGLAEGTGRAAMTTTTGPDSLPTMSFGTPFASPSQVRAGRPEIIAFPVVVSDGSLFASASGLRTRVMLAGKPLAHTAWFSRGSVRVGVTAPTDAVGDELVVSVTLDNFDEKTGDAIPFSATATFTVGAASGAGGSGGGSPSSGQGKIGKPIACIRVMNGSGGGDEIIDVPGLKNLWETFVDNVCRPQITVENVDEWFPHQKITLIVPSHPHADSPHLTGFSVHGDHVHWTWVHVPGSDGTRLVQDLNVQTTLVPGIAVPICNRMTVTIRAGTKTLTGDYSRAVRGSQSSCLTIVG